MTELNLILAAVALCSGMLVNRAYAPHVSLRKPEPSDYLALSIGVALNAYLLRTSYWDIWWPLMGGVISSPMVNMAINAAVILASYFALKARLLMIPPRARWAYNIFTCAWYPRSARVTVKNEEE